MSTTDPSLPALVTGASRGLGFALAAALARRGHHVIAVARTVGALEELDDAIKAAGGAATLAPLDITDDGAMQHLCRSIHDRWGGLSFWAHTAIHAIPLTPANMVDAKSWDRALAVNVTATWRLISYVAPLLPLDTGRALFFEDLDVAGAKFFGGFGATKAAQIALARSWQAETKKIGPRVDILQPPPLPTACRARFFPGEDRSRLMSSAEAAEQLLTSLDL